jgi:hypothetical protein
LGKIGKDKVTGFEGVITSFTAYLYGSNSFYLELANDKGEAKGRWFDVSRIEIVENS